MANTSKTDTPGRRDLAYYRQRQRNRVFTALAKFFTEEAAAGKITKKELATKLAKDPSQITRLLSAPSNLELDTISDYLLAMGAEMDHSIVRFVDRECARRLLVRCHDRIHSLPRTSDTELATSIGQLLGRIASELGAPHND